MNDLKKGLINAGFEEIKEDIKDGFSFRLLTKPSNLPAIYVNPHNKSLWIMPKHRKGDTIHTQDAQFKDLEELNKICYGTLLRDLDFEKQTK